MTDAQLQEMQEAFSRMEAVVGMQFVGKSSAELAAALTPDHALADGRYPLVLSDHQLHRQMNDWGDMNGKIKALEARLAALEGKATPTSAPVASTVTPAPAPAPTGPTIPGLSPQQIAAVNQALDNGVNAGMPIAAIRDRVRSELSQGIYSYADRTVIDAVKLWHYSDKCPRSDQLALDDYLHIIDQRDPLTDPNATLAANDPRLKHVSGSAVAPAPAPVAVSGDLVSQLTSMGVVIETDPTDGKPYIAAIKYTSFGAPEGTVYGYSGINDAAMRIFYNIAAKIGLPWSAGQNRNPNLPSIMGPVMERDGGLSFGTHLMKKLLIYINGFLSNDGPFVDFIAWQPGKGLRFSTQPTGSQTKNADPALELRPDSPNGVAVRVGGVMRPIVVGADGRPDFG